MLFFVWRNTGKSVMDYVSCADKSTGQDEYIEVRFNFPLLPRSDDEDQFSIGKRRKRARGDVSGVHGYNNFRSPMALQAAVWHPYVFSEGVFSFLPKDDISLWLVLLAF